MSAVFPPPFRGANGTVPGVAGLVPTPAATDHTKFLRGAGDYVAISGGGDMLAANNLGDVASVSAARTSLAVYSTGETLALTNPRAPMQGLWFDGTSQRAEAVLGAALGVSDFCIAACLDVPSASSATSRTVLHLASARAEGIAGEFILGWRFDELQVFRRGATVADYRLTPFSGLIAAHAGKRISVLLTRSGATLTLKVNGSVWAAAADVTNGTPPAWSDAFDGTLLTLGRAGESYTLTGFFGPLVIANFIPTAAEQARVFEQASPLAEYTNRSSVDAIPSALITGDDATFASATGNWALASATISGGKLNMSGGGTAALTTKTLKAGQRYRYSITIDSADAGKSLWFHDGVAFELQIASAGNIGTRTGTFTMVADGYFRMLSESGASVIDNVSVDPVGLVLSLDHNAPGAGPQWPDVSGNNAHVNLPTDGTTGARWALPGGGRADFGETRTASGFALGRDAVVIPVGYRIARIWVAGNGTFSIGNAAAGTEIVNAFTATSTTQPATLAGYVTASRKLYITLGTATTLTYCAQLERI